MNEQIKQKEFCKILFKLNLCVAYPINDKIIELWSENLIRLMPETTVEELNSLIDRYLLGEMVYAPEKGLGNITANLKILRRK